MESSLTMASFPSLLHPRSFPNPSLPIFKTGFSRGGAINMNIRATSSNSNASTPNPIVSTLKATTAAVVFAAAVFGNFHKFPPARAESPPTVTEKLEEKTDGPVETNPTLGGDQENSPLTQFLESNSEAIEALESLLKQKLEEHENEESFEILKKLCAAQPENMEWKFLMARLLNEMGHVREANQTFEDILSKNPLSFEALFENALLMDRCGESETVLKRLEDALKIADEENKAKEARDIRFIMAQVQFLQRNIEEALQCYEELEKEDPKDFRPYFCKGMIYTLLDKNDEARKQFDKYKELSPINYDVEAYLRTPLSRVKLFGTDEN